MADVVDASKWSEVVQRIKEVADTTGAEFNWKRWPDGKEVVEIRQYYKPEKESKNVKSS